LFASDDARIYPIDFVFGNPIDDDFMFWAPACQPTIPVSLFSGTLGNSYQEYNLILQPGNARIKRADDREIIARGLHVLRSNHECA